MTDYFESGFAVREPSWHAKETLLAEAPTLETWREAAGLTWEPVKVPLYLPSEPIGINPDGRPVYGEPRESGTYAVVRNDRVDSLYDADDKVRDKAVLARGVADTYTPLEHERDMTPLLDALLTAAESMGTKAELTTAGSVRNGKQVYACVMLDRPIQIGNDPSLTLPFGVLLNRHDAGGALRGGLTAVRVVCANTYAFAESDMDNHGLDFRIQHEGDPTERLEQARTMIAGWVDAVESYEDRMQYLHSLPVSDDVVTDWLDEFLPVDHYRMTERQVAKRTEERATFLATYNGSDTTDGIRGTAYGLWQTTTEFMDHLRPWRSADSYLRRTMLDPSESKHRAHLRIEVLATV